MQSCITNLLYANDELFVKTSAILRTEYGVIVIRSNIVQTSADASVHFTPDLDQLPCGVLTGAK